jgi:cell division protein FtsB
MNVVELLKIALPFIAGGGLTWLLNYRVKRRQIKNSIAIEEYSQVDAMVKKYIQTVDELSDQLTANEREINKLHQLITKIETENRLLRHKIERDGPSHTFTDPASDA